jgi:ribosomal protein L29
MGKIKQDLNNKSSAELGDDAAKLRKEIFDLQFKHSTKTLTDTMSIRRTRRQLARVLTAANHKKAAQ